LIVRAIAEAVVIIDRTECLYSAYNGFPADKSSVVVGRSPTDAPILQKLFLLPPKEFKSSRNAVILCIISFFSWFHFSNFLFKPLLLWSISSSSMTQFEVAKHKSGQLRTVTKFYVNRKCKL